jgi:iron complex transport system permease protein
MEVRPMRPVPLPRGRTAILLAVLGFSVLISLRFGPHRLSWADLFQLWLPSMAAGADTARATVETLIYGIRLPRIIAGMAVGAALSVAGVSYQGLFRNSLVSPDILGASAGAAFGASIGILFSWSILGIQALAFLFGLLAVGTTCVLSRSMGGAHFALRLVLTGMVVGSLFAAGISVIKVVADPYSKLPAITFWLMGGLSAVTARDTWFLLPPLAAGVCLLLALRWPLNTMALGEEEARALGVPTGLIRVLTLLGATLITSASVAVGGIIGWVGLMVPHLARFWVGPNHRDLLPTALLTGAIYLLWADNIARWLFSVEFPLGIVTCACGVPAFVVLLRRSQKSWAS